MKTTRTEPRKATKREATVETEKKTIRPGTEAQTIYCKAHTKNPKSRKQYRTRNDRLTTTAPVDEENAEFIMFGRRRNKKVQELSH